jgi:hypothetical protein
MAYLITNNTDAALTLALRGDIAIIEAGETIISKILIPTNPLYKMAKEGKITLERLTTAQYSALETKGIESAGCSGEGCDKAECCTKEAEETSQLPQAPPATLEPPTEVAEPVIIEVAVTESTEEVAVEAVTEVITEEVAVEAVTESTEEVVEEATEEVTPKKRSKK